MGNFTSRGGKMSECVIENPSDIHTANFENFILISFMNAENFRKFNFETTNNGSNFFNIIQLLTSIVTGNQFVCCEICFYKSTLKETLICFSVTPQRGVFCYEKTLDKDLKTFNFPISPACKQNAYNFLCGKVGMEFDRTVVFNSLWSGEDVFKNGWNCTSLCIETLKVSHILPKQIRSKCFSVDEFCTILNSDSYMMAFHGFP